MTLQELNQFFRLLEKLSRARELLASLEAAAAPRSPQLDGMPHAPGVGDRTGKLAEEIADMSARVQALEREARVRRKKIGAFIETVSDDRARLILRLRFLRGLSWGEVAAVIGGGNTENGVKCACYRCLRENLHRRDAP